MRMKKLILILFLFVGFGLSAQAGVTEIEDVLDETSIIKGEAAEVQANFTNGILTVENAPLNTTVEVFSMVGVSVFRGIITEQPNQQFLFDLKKGFYIVAVGKTTKKISVK